MPKKLTKAQEDEAHTLMVIDRMEWGDAEARLRIVEGRARKAIANRESRIWRHKRELSKTQGTHPG